MKLTKLILAAAVAFTAPLSMADKKDPNLGLIKARKAEMQLRSFNAGPLFARAKGKMDYDAELAASAANNLKQVLDQDMGRAWAEGTANDNYKKTRSLPEIWTTYPEIVEYGKEYAEAVNAIAATAGDGVEALQANVGALGKSCKGCHDTFRAEKK